MTKGMKIFTLVCIGVAYLWLASYILIRGGVTLYNILICLMAGTIIFVPIWRKFFPDGRDPK